MPRQLLLPRPQIRHLLLRRHPHAVPSSAQAPYACGMTSERPTAATGRCSAAIERVLRHIEQHLGQPLTLAELAELAGLSMWRFATVFRHQVGVSPHRYICRLRVERAQALMREGISAAAAASEAGFYDQSHLSRHFKNMYGMTPGQYLSAARHAAA
jgi:transcriptional regulator GlxA family with amidase domain